MLAETNVHLGLEVGMEPEGEHFWFAILKRII